MADNATDKTPQQIAEELAAERAAQERAAAERAAAERAARERAGTPPSSGPAPIHYRRTNDPAGVCRPARLLGEVEPGGFLHLRFGQLPGAVRRDPKTGEVLESDRVTFDVTRPHSHDAAPETWHEAGECPFGHAHELREPRMA